MSDHCKHCDPDCNGGTEYEEGPNVWVAYHYSEDEAATWKHVYGCPTCAESKRIADKCEKQANKIANLQPAKGDDWECQRTLRLSRIGILMDVVRIAKGESE